MGSGTKLRRQAERLLRDSGMAFSIEEGRRHHKIMVGRAQVAILPRGKHRDRLRGGALSDIGRALRRLADRTSERMP